MADARQSPSGSAQPLNKACEPCRSLKVRCLPATDGPNASCQRCIKFNRPCVYAAPHRKKQRKRTDARVTELEKEILAMRALLDRTHKQIALADLAQPPQSQRSPSTASVMASPTQNTPDSNEHSSTASQQLDIVDRGLITIEEARRLLTVYKTECLPHFPLVAIRREQTADELRETHPILFKAIMTTSSASARPDLYTQLSTEILQEYVQRVMINGEKTLELVQAISITSSWYHPTDTWSSLRFYDYITLASSMTIDMGLSERETFITIRDPMENLARKRALIGCFTHSSAVAFGLRRPNTLPFSTYMADILEELDTSPLAQSSDWQLGATARLYKMADEISTTFSLTDAGREGQVTDIEFQHHITSFAHRLQNWKDTYRADQTSLELLHMYHHLQIALHETPLHQVYPPTWFKLPYHLHFPSKRSTSFTPVANQALSVACASAHSMCDIFLARELRTIRSAPGSYFAGVLFSLMTLVSISLIPDIVVPPTSAASSHGHPAGNLEFYREMTQAAPLLDKVIARMMEAAGRMEYRIPSLFCVSLGRLRKWLRWVGEMRRRGQDPARWESFSILAGPEGHACLAEEEQDGGEVEGGGVVGEKSGLRPAAATMPLAQGGPMVTGLAPEVDWGEGIDVLVDGEVDWMGALEGDYSSILDPALWEPDVGFMNLATQ
ncbi:hypothetical protein K461DRAFT_232408 [Myriangium duriaei CBS 260.36]|uniref:Zn(2)-C6 fungal-type domain-containing protein n=1 Tax=Myriangium duriaei CBS 260.36 TaxID=1168546 RepID=A0A9P4MD93_9PEZI|nr:hypothetical protein K461DRAFT_232408 [Myriangium duriaei CBS 260.36]